MPAHTRDIESECQSLVLAFAHHIDRHQFEEAVAIFTENAVFERPDHSFNGQAEMLAFWSQRPPEHITRHLCCTPFLTELNADSAKAITQVTLYQAEKGDSPVATINNPAAIIEFHDSFVKTDVGWKIAHRRGVPVLMFA